MVVLNVITDELLTDISGVICDAHGTRLYSIRPVAHKPAFDTLVAAGIDPTAFFGTQPVFGIRRVEDENTVTIYSIDTGAVLIEYEA